VIAAAISLLLAQPAAAADNWDSGYEACQLKVTGLPPDAPRFGDFPAQPDAMTRQATPRLDSRMARRFRTEIRKQAKLGPDFAGHYRVAVWGCGTGCASFGVVDLKTGAIVFPPDLTTVEQVASAPLDHLTYRADSRLLVVTGAPDEDFKRLGIRFYVIGRKGLRLTKMLSYAEACPATSN
jgi:hypothetical protein